MTMAFCVFTKLLVICFCITIFFTINTAADGEFNPEVEQPAISILVKPLGDREYLPPSLKSVVKLAHTHLPKSLRLISVLEAFREITNLVRYELIVKSIDNTNTEVICHIVVKEKPWLSSQFGKKYRFLDHTNCSSYYNTEELDNEENYEPLAYNQREPEVPYNNLISLETQILPKPQNTEENFEEISEKPQDLSRDAAAILDSLFDIPPEISHSEKEANVNMKNDGSNEERSPNSRVKRSTDTQKISKNMQNIASETNIGRVRLEKKDYSNLKSFIEEYLENVIADEEKYRIIKAFEVRNQNNLEEEQEIIIELANRNGTQINCQIKIRPNTENKSKELKVDIYCPNLIDITVSTNTLNKQHQRKEKAKKLIHHAPALFLKYQSKYNKNYHQSERASRYSTFKKNLAKIDELNEHEQGTAVYGITQFADLTEDEFRQRTGLLIGESKNNIKNIVADIPNFKLPSEFDWRKRGAVSKVKNQGVCGSCWAFSVTGNIEGLHAIRTGKLEEYSEQELLDCDSIDSACLGGLPDNAYKAIEDLGGLELESEYPYKAKKDKCHFNNTLVHAKIKGAVDLPKNETAMALWLVANGPISIGINANAMQFYRGGISHPWKLLCRPGSIDHGVLIVGFGVKEYPRFNKTLPYWLIKNSWGDRWGEQGYYRVYRGDNTCGVNTMASSAILA